MLLRGGAIGRPHIVLRGATLTPETNRPPTVSEAHANAVRRTSPDCKYSDSRTIVGDSHRQSAPSTPDSGCETPQAAAN